MTPPRVKESVFSVECRLYEVKEFESKNPATPGKKSGVMAILEGVNFWAREDAVNEDLNLIDPAVCKPSAFCLLLFWCPLMEVALI